MDSNSKIENEKIIHFSENEKSKDSEVVSFILIHFKCLFFYKNQIFYN